MMLNRIILWLLLAFACLLPASALTVTAPENSVWEIFSIGYDAAVTEATDLGNRTETPTSNYDSAPIHRAATETKPTAAERPLFGPNAEFKAAEEAGVSYRIGQPVEQEGGLDWALQSPQQRIDTVVGKYGFNLQGKTVSYDGSLGTGQFGATAKANPMILRIGPDALASEQETAATIAHELRHSRAYLGSGENTEAAAEASENAMRDYIQGKR